MGNDGRLSKRVLETKMPVMVQVLNERKDYWVLFHAFWGSNESASGKCLWIRAIVWEVLVYVNCFFCIGLWGFSDTGSSQRGKTCRVPCTGTILIFLVYVNKVRLSL